jgi:hypothetical protein
MWYTNAIRLAEATGRNGCFFPDSFTGKAGRRKGVVLGSSFERIGTRSFLLIIYMEAEKFKLTVMVRTRTIT